MIEESYVNYEVGMALKEMGFNEWCRLCYTTAIRHNGKDLSFDEELDLKGAGRAGEIEYIPGGNCEQLSNRNKLDFVEGNTDCCSCPTIQMAIAWLEQKHHIYVMVAPYKPGLWKTIMVYTNNPDPRDGKLNVCELDEIHKSHDEAANFGLKYGLGIVKKIQEKLKEKGGGK